jgi:hypothetical protein
MLILEEVIYQSNFYISGRNNFAYIVAKFQELKLDKMLYL